MPKRKNDLEAEIDELTANWVGVNRSSDPIEWGAWTAWREREMRTRARPENLTVPTPFPPATVAAAKEYLETVRKMRRLHGWGAMSSGRLTNDPVAWRPEDIGVRAAS